MKFIVFFFFAILAVSLALPLEPAKILRYENDNSIDGYSFAYDTSDGVSRAEEGQLKNAGTKDEVFVVRGSYQYVGPDGVTYKVTFIADENGFQPIGAHLPVPPV